MSSTGSPEPQAAPRPRHGWAGIALAFGLVVLAVFLGFQILGVLYGLLFPPRPPVLNTFSEIDHTSPSYGVDDWLYASSDDACRIARFYSSNGATCSIAPELCDGGFVGAISGISPSQGTNIARCTGDIGWSIFTQRYYVNIATGYAEDNPSRVRLERDIYWTGALPAGEVVIPTVTPSPE